MQGMRELLRSSLGKSLSGLTPLDRVSAAWPVACGTHLAERGRVTALEDGRLTVEVADAGWLQQLRAMGPQLLGELRRIARVELREIHFETGGERRPEPSKAVPGTSPKTAKGRAAKPNRR